jgi:hypothetical protein
MNSFGRVAEERLKLQRLILASALEYFEQLQWTLLGDSRKPVFFVGTRDSGPLSDRAG